MGAGVPGALMPGCCPNCGCDVGGGLVGGCGCAEAAGGITPGNTAAPGCGGWNVPCGMPSCGTPDGPGVAVARGLPGSRSRTSSGPSGRSITTLSDLMVC